MEGYLELSRGQALAADSIIVCGFFCFVKSVLRAAVGKAPDRRGWGNEAYLAWVFYHAASIAVCAWLAALSLPQADWWAPRNSTGLDHVLAMMTCAEAVTDPCFYACYPAFGAAVWLHRIAACTGAASFISLSAVPVGAVVCFVGSLNVAGLAVNVVHVLRHQSPRMFRARNVIYSCCCLCALGILTLATLGSAADLLMADWMLTEDSPLRGTSGADAGVLAVWPWQVATPAWVVMALNLHWMRRMWASHRRNTGPMVVHGQAAAEQDDSDDDQLADLVPSTQSVAWADLGLTAPEAAEPLAAQEHAAEGEDPDAVAEEGCLTEADTRIW